jgi:hypothetical protein
VLNCIFGLALHPVGESTHTRIYRVINKHLTSEGEIMYANTTGPVIFNIPYFCKVSVPGNDFRFTFHCVKHHVGVEVECAWQK